MHKVLIISLISLLAIFQLQLYYASGGYLTDKAIKARLASSLKAKNMLQTRNDQLKNQVASLRGSTISLEANARQRLNLIKPSETLVLLPQD